MHIFLQSLSSLRLLRDQREIFFFWHKSLWAGLLLTWHTLILNFFATWQDDCVWTISAVKLLHDACISFQLAWSFLSSIEAKRVTWAGRKPPCVTVNWAYTRVSCLRNKDVARGQKMSQYLIHGYVQLLRLSNLLENSVNRRYLFCDLFPWKTIAKWCSIEVRPHIGSRHKLHTKLCSQAINFEPSF